MRKKITKKKSFAMFLAMTLVMSNFSQVGIMADEGKSKEGTLGEKVASLSGNSETIGDYECNILEDGVEIVEYYGKETDLKIPTVLGKNKVTSIGSGAFRNCDSLINVDIPEGVTSIDSAAFADCDNLTSIDIPEGVVDIGGGAFRSCDSLINITLPSMITRIAEGTFYGCSSLSGINIPKGVTSIGDSAFYGCSSLSSINIPEGVTIIDIEVFSGCSSLSSINIPEGVACIGLEAFYGCSSLGSINIPKGVTDIGFKAFSGCSSLTNIAVAEGNERYSSADGILYSADGKTLICCPAGKKGDIEIPAEVTSIRYYAFADCSGITSVNIPKGLTEIWYNS